MRVLVADPIGHLLGMHDREICQGLVQAGFEVVLATNEGYPFAFHDNGFEIITPFQGCVGDSNLVVKGANYLAALRRLLREALHRRPDVLVLYFHQFPLADTQFLRRLAREGIRTVFCAHDVLPWSLERDPFGIYHRLYQNAWRVLCFSDYARNELISQFRFPAAKAWALRFGEDWSLADASGSEETGQARARAQFGFAPDEQLFLCFGQIKKNKGLEYLLPAFAKTALAYPKAKLLVIGRPRKVDFSVFPALARELGIENRVVFRPEHIPEPEVARYFRASDAVVIPYTRLYQSAVIPKACMYSKPLAATRVGDVTEILEDGVSAHLVPPRDAAALADAMTDILARPEEARRRGRLARKIAQDKYSWPFFTQRFAELLRDSETGSDFQGASMTAGK